MVVAERHVQQRNKIDTKNKALYVAYWLYTREPGKKIFQNVGLQNITYVHKE